MDRKLTSSRLNMITLNICGLWDMGNYVDLSFTDVVSIGDAGAPAPNVNIFASKPAFHRFEFEDIANVAATAPTKEHVVGLIAIADALLARSDDVNVLYHCMGGRSRSTAAAFILCVRAGMTYDQAWDQLILVRGHIQPILGPVSPNLLIIKHADILMNQGGKMLDFIASKEPEKQAWVKANGYTFA